MTKITIVGGGNMGMAFAEGLIGRKVIQNDGLCIVEPDTARSSEIKHQLGCFVQNEIDSFITDSDAIVLAVKPQIAKDVLGRLKPFIDPETSLLISVMAGVSISSIKKLSGGCKKIVRTMPNLPAQCGLSVTAYTTLADLNETEESLTESILRSVGEILKVKDEEVIDKVTAISGSGPGYVYYLMESLINSAKEMGFSPEEAKLLVVQTFKGSVAQLEKTDLEPAELRKRVTSKGGTTAAAISHFEKENLPEILKEGVLKAFKRAAELAVLAGE